MAEVKTTVRGVVVEFDFAVLDGAQILFDTAKKSLAEAGVDLDVKLEALHLVGGNIQGGLTELFEKLENKHSPAKAARELGEAFAAALKEKLATGFTPAFKAFVKTLAAKNVKVILASRAGAEALADAMGDLTGDLVVPFTEMSTTYGNCKWDAWRRAAHQNGIQEVLSAAVTGSGEGVKSALVAGFCALGVVHPHTAWQDFGGADTVVDGLDAAAANEILRMLHLA